jgi:membrane protein implicated in regulation of membrane protease activity
MYLTNIVAVVAVIAAVILGFVRAWWAGGLCAGLAVASFLVLLRIVRSGTDAERAALIDLGERAIGAAGRAQSGGWSPRRRR